MLKSVYVKTGAALIAASLALLLAAGAGVGQDTTGILKRAKQNFDAFTGKAKDIKMVTAMTAASGAGTVTNRTTLFYKGVKSRVESKIEIAAGAGSSMAAGPVETVILNDGKNTWMASNFIPKRKLNVQEAEDFVTERQWWNCFPDSAKIVGSEQYGGRDCHVVKINLPNVQRPVTAWLDKQKLTIIGGSGNVQGKEMRWIHSDFREIEGREMPFKTELFAKDVLVSTVVVESIEANTGLSDELFDPKALEVGNKSSLEEMRKQWNSTQQQ